MYKASVFFNPFCLPCSAASNLFRIDNKLFYQKKFRAARENDTGTCDLVVTLLCRGTCATAFVS